MQIIELILTNESQKKLSLFFKLRNNSTSERYGKLLATVSHKENLIANPRRTYNFPNDVRNCAWISQKILECIQTINAWQPTIEPFEPSPTLTQDHLNYLHSRFEKLRGSVKQPAEFYLSSPPEIKAALHTLNLLIHRYEDRARVETTPRPEDFARMVVTFFSKWKSELLPEDYFLFTLQTKWGCWYLDYFELGKPLIDVFHDNDHLVGDDNIRPLREMGANAMVSFSKTMSRDALKDYYRKFSEWWDLNEQRLSALGFIKNDPKNAVGSIPVADLMRSRGKINGMSRKHILKLVAKYPIIHRVDLRKVP